jgi:type I restriction enzyme S subunit
MTEWKEYKLGEIATFISEKVSVKDISVENYISTENMVSDKGGITVATNKPLDGTITKYYPNNILVSNIRPYFKKIWFSNRDGGCSNDVLCFEANTKYINPKYLYFLLSQDLFFDYVMLGSKGCKMPRGDKSHIMNWDISLPPLPEQIRIASILSSLDDKIDLLHRENKTLEAMAETLFRQWFIEEAKEDWEEVSLTRVANFLNGLACQKFPPKNEIEKLPVLKIRELSNGIGNDSDYATTDVEKEYIVHAGDVIFAWSASLMVKIWDGRDCILNQHLFKVTSEKYPKWFYYFWCKHHLDEFISIAQSHATTMGHIKRNDLDTAMVLVPSDEELLSMTAQMEGLLRKKENNNEQINTLIQTRDGLLPRLMGGELKITEI